MMDGRRGKAGAWSVEGWKEGRDEEIKRIGNRKGATCRLAPAAL